MAKRSLAAVSRQVGDAIVALEAEVRRLEKVRAPARERLRAVRLIDNLVEKQLQLETLRYVERDVRKQKQKREARAQKQRRRDRATSGAQLLGERELTVRGYWDRYPKTDQRTYPKRYGHVPSVLRKGPTSFDLLLRDYDSFTRAQKRRLSIRVAYGMDRDGNILSESSIVRSGLIVHLLGDDTPESRALSIVALRALLVRAGVVDTPSEWRVNDDVEDSNNVEEVPLILGVQWWTGLDDDE